MSEFKNFNEENPNNNDNAYVWNGNGPNKPQRNVGGIVAVVVAVVAVLAAITAVVFAVTSRTSVSLNYNGEKQSLQVPGPGSLNSAPTDLTPDDFSDRSDNSVQESRPDYEVPEFTPSGDANEDNSNVFTQIYENCSPSCCTITVYSGGSLYSIGSGFVIDDKNGYIATNHHVIENGDEVKVVFYNGARYDAVIVGSNSTTDLAVLKIEAEGLKQVELGDSNNVKVGETVVAIGTPYDQSLAGTMTSGIISGVARGVEITNSSGKVVKVMTLLQTDCSINPGNSGGALFDMSGNVVGITSLKLVDEEFEGIGFAIPITDAAQIFRKLIAGEPITDNGVATASPRIGITVYELEYGLSEFNINPTCAIPQGLLVGSVDNTTAAYKAGLSLYDIITDFNGETIENLDDLDTALSKYKAGDEVVVTVFRLNREYSSGESLLITFKLDAAA